MQHHTKPAETGAQLRSLYEPQGGVEQIFSNKVTDYAASRPDYPDALFTALRCACDLQQGSTVADIGAGTGLLTKGLLAQGYAVTAIEPSASMRAAADDALSSFAGYLSASGSAEQLPMPTSSVDLITAAQAFHWFDVKAARTEFLRVLKPQGKVALIWNDRVLSDPLHIALNGIFAQHGGEKRGAMLAHDERSEVPAFFGSSQPKELTWPHEHHLSEAALLSLVFSRSYMPAQESAAGLRACEQVREVFQRLATDGRIAVRYNTVAIIGRPQGCGLS